MLRLKCSQKPFNEAAHDLPPVLTCSEESPVPAPFLAGEEACSGHHCSPAKPILCQTCQSPRPAVPIPQMHATAWRFVRKFVGKICINPNIALIEKEDGRRSEDKENTAHRRPRSARAQTRQHPGGRWCSSAVCRPTATLHPQEKVTQEHQCPASRMTHVSWPRWKRAALV